MSSNTAGFSVRIVKTPWLGLGKILHVALIGFSAIPEHVFTVMVPVTFTLPQPPVSGML